jgi:hypothetical protein
MRSLLVALLVSMSAFSAQSRELQVADASSAVSAEPSLHRQVEKRLEALGYKNLKLEQGVLVVRAKDETDQAVVLLVDPETLSNLKIYDPDEEPSTTGSGSR